MSSKRLRNRFDEFGKGAGRMNGLRPTSLVVLFGLLDAACAPASQPPPAPPAGNRPLPAAAPTQAPAAAAKPAAGGATGAVSVAMVGNPQMKTLEQLKGDFESSHPGITQPAGAARKPGPRQGH